MAKYDNAYIENLNRQLAEASTRLAILTEYAYNWEKITPYGMSDKFIKLILDIPVTESEEKPNA